MDARMVSLHRYRQDEYAQRLASDAKTNEWGRCSCENDPEGCREKRHRWIAFYDENAPERRNLLRSGVRAITAIRSCAAKRSG